MKKMVKHFRKKGQVTIFVIIAIIIVASVAIFFTATETGRRINPFIDVDVNVEESLTQCIETDSAINEKIGLIMRQGGSYEPEFFYPYNNTERLGYLCYTNLYFETCVMQNPMLISNTKKEIKENVEDNVRDCFDNVKKELERNGYKVSADEFGLDVDLVPENIVFNIDTRLTASRGEDSATFEGLKINKKSRIYELEMIAISVLNFEARYGDSETTNYMMLYPEIRLAKLKQSDGTTLYFITHRETGETFSFASKSVVLPAGYII